MDTKIIKSTFGKMVAHADSIHENCDGIIGLCGEILTQVQRMDNYALAFRNQLIEVIDQSQDAYAPSMSIPEIPRENLKAIGNNGASPNDIREPEGVAEDTKKRRGANGPASVLPSA